MKQTAAPQGAVQITPDILKNAKTFECPECGGKTFKEVMIIKKISPILSPSGQEEYFPMNIIACQGCGLMPKELDKGRIIPEEFLTEK